MFLPAEEVSYWPLRRIIHVLIDTEKKCYNWTSQFLVSFKHDNSTSCKNHKI